MLVGSLSAMPFLIYQPSSETLLHVVVIRKIISISFHAICSSHNPYFKMKVLSEPSSVFTMLLTSFSPCVHTFGTITVNYASKRRTYERESLFFYTFSLRSMQPFIMLFCYDFTQRDH